MTAFSTGEKPSLYRAGKAAVHQSDIQASWQIRPSLPVFERIVANGGFAHEDTICGFDVAKERLAAAGFEQCAKTRASRCSIS